MVGPPTTARRTPSHQARYRAHSASPVDARRAGPYDTLVGASHAQCNTHIVRHLAAVGEVWDQTASTRAMTTCLFEAKAGADTARDKGETAVAPVLIAGFERRYDEARTEAFAVLPAGVPPRRRGQRGWREHQRQAWNLATCMTKITPALLDQANRRFEAFAEPAWSAVTP